MDKNTLKDLEMIGMLNEGGAETIKQFTGKIPSQSLSQIVDFSGSTN